METRILRIEPQSYRREDLAPVARALAEGALVAFPTETVYGFGARRDDPAAVERLQRLKGRDPTKPLTLHAPSVESALAHVKTVPARALPLMRRFWPGPVTIVFPDQGGGIGIRVPAHPVAQDLLALAGVPVIASSANLSGEAPLTRGTDVIERFRGEVDWIIDGGETPIKDASTVVRVSDRGWECLREGIIGRDTLARYLDTTVLFVCTGNSCRSPMAEALFRRKLAERLGIDEESLDDHGFHVRSAGTSASDGGPASALAVRVMEDRAIDLSRHRARSITEEMVEQATIIFTMSPSHADSIAEWWPEHRAKVHPLDEAGVVDPIGGPPEVYRQCADAIDRLLDDALDRILPRELASLVARERAGGGAPS